MAKFQLLLHTPDQREKLKRFFSLWTGQGVLGGSGHTYLNAEDLSDSPSLLKLTNPKLGEGDPLKALLCSGSFPPLPVVHVCACAYVCLCVCIRVFVCVSVCMCVSASHQH